MEKAAKRLPGFGWGLLLALLPAVSAWAGDVPWNRTGQALGFPLEITVWAADATAAARALEAGFTEVGRVEQVFYALRQGSAVNEINQFAGSRPVEVSPEVMAVLQQAEAVAAATRGACDITTAAYAWEYGFGQGEFHVPAPERLEELKSVVGYKNVILYPRDRTVVFKRDGVQIDLGEIARSHALTCAQAVLPQAGVAAARIRLGNSVALVKANPTGGFWTVSVPHPRDPRKVLATVDVPGGKVLSSGDYDRFFMQNGARYADILEPGTGKPAPYALAATLWLPENSKLDLPSEALLLLPPAQALQLVAAIPGAQALIVDAQKNIWLTPGWKGKLKIQW